MIELSFSSFYKKSILLAEGGQAAEKLVGTLVTATGNEKLKYVRTTPSPGVLDEIQNLLTLLRTKKFIDPRKPSYYLGSSRLFAIKAGLKAPEPDEIETPEIIDKALQAKKDFGDVDLDVYLNPGATLKDIQIFLNTNYPQKYAASAGGEEINVAVNVEGTNNVVQIDIVNIKGKEKYFGVSQFASMADMAESIKGVVRDLLIRSIAASTPISSEKRNIIDNLVENSPEYKHFITKNKDKGELSYDVRYTLGGDGLAYRIKWMINGKESSVTLNKVKLDQLHKFINSEEVKPVPYEDIETIAKIMGFQNPNDVKHVVKMAELVSKLDAERKQSIWDTLIKNIKSKLPDLSKGRTQGQISEEEAKKAFEFLKPFFGNIDTSEYKQSFQESLLSEAAKMVSIPHIDQMTAKDFCSLFSGGAWEVSEKYDGSNVSFGLTEEGSLFVKTKRGYPVTDPTEYYRQAKAYDNDIFEGFGRLLEALQQSNLVSFLKRVEEKLKAPVQIFGEMFSKPHMNVIPYAAELIGYGAVVVFGVVKLDTPKGTDITTTKPGRIIKDNIIKELNDSSNWKFYDKKPLELDIDNKIKQQITKTCSAENMAVMASRKRTGGEAEAKAIAVQEFKKLQAMIKQTLLGAVGKVPSSLGAEEIEGAIIRNMETGAIAKLVDLEGFGKRRAEQWAGIDALKDFRKALYNELKDDVLQNADIFVLDDKQIQKLTDAMEIQGSRFATLDQMLEVLYGDAAQEIQFKEAKQMVNDLVNSLNKYKKDIENALAKISKTDAKAIEDTKKAIEAEKKRIDQFVMELTNRLKANENPYLSVIHFVLGPKILDDLSKKFLKQ